MHIGSEHSEEVRLRISVSTKAAMNRPEIKEKMIAANRRNARRGAANNWYGKPGTRLGVTLSEETKQKISVARKNYFNNGGKVTGMFAKGKSRYKQGFFKPLKPEKYIGNTANIIYRSWLEFRVMSKLDMDPTIVKWASEEFSIPYVSPLDGLSHRYFPDLYFEKKEKGKIQKYICEVKPFAQCEAPKSKGKKLLTEARVLATNLAKWQSATRWAKQRACKFIIWTEKDLPG